MAKKNYTSLQSQPMHIENTVLTLGKEDLAQGKAFSTYRDMKLDGVISGSMSFIKGVISKQFPTISTPDDADQRERTVITKLNESLTNGDVYTPMSLMSNWLTTLDYGISLNEVVFKREGGYSVFDVISPIHLSSVEKFTFNKGKLHSILLNPAENDGLVAQYDFTAQRAIAGDKLMMIRNEADQDFPLGKSLLYGAYTSWKIKKILQEYEAIGVAKNLSGVLKLKIPSEYINAYLTDPSSDEGLYVQNLIDTAELLHAGKGSYVLAASDTNSNGVPLFDVDVIGGSGGNAQNYNVGEVIRRYNQEILSSMQTTVLAMGQEGGGSFALSDNQTNFLTLFIEYIRAEINAGFKSAVKKAYELNGLETKRVPDLMWPPVQDMDWDEFTKGWNRLLQCGGVTATEDLEQFLRTRGGAPKADYSKILDNPTKADSSERAGDKEK